eukprot:IDg18404t1
MASISHSSAQTGKDILSAWAPRTDGGQCAKSQKNAPCQRCHARIVSGRRTRWRERQRQEERRRCGDRRCGAGHARGAVGARRGTRGRRRRAPPKTGAWRQCGHGCVHNSRLVSAQYSRRHAGIHALRARVRVEHAAMRAHGHVRMQMSLQPTMHLAPRGARRCRPTPACSLIVETLNATLRSPREHHDLAALQSVSRDPINTHHE